MADLLDKTANETVADGSPTKKDANDYSRFDDLDGSSDSDDGINNSPEEPVRSVSESIAIANMSKNEGNNAFKATQFVEGILSCEWPMYGL